MRAKIPNVELQENPPRQSSIARRDLIRNTLFINIQLLILILISHFVAFNSSLVLLRVVRSPCLGRKQSRTPPRGEGKEPTFWGKPGAGPFLVWVVVRARFPVWGYTNLVFSPSEANRV
jgi:hypothetical protein